MDERTLEEKFFDRIIEIDERLDKLEDRIWSLEIWSAGIEEKYDAKRIRP